MKVINIARHSVRDTAAILKHLTEENDRGQVSGLMVRVRHPNGREESANSGLYKHKPSEAISAALRHWLKLVGVDVDVDDE